MAPLLRGKGALAPNLPFFQSLPVFICTLSIPTSLDRGFEVAVLQLAGAAPVMFAEALAPHRATDTVRLLCLILPEQSAGTAVQPIESQSFPLRAQVGVLV